MFGGLPHGASQAASGFVYQDVPHALTQAEIAEIVEEYGWSAARAGWRTRTTSARVRAREAERLQWQSSA